MAEKADRLMMLAVVIWLSFISVLLVLVLNGDTEQTTRLTEMDAKLARIEQQVSTALILRRDLVEEVEGLRRDFCLAINTGDCAESK